MPIKRDPVYQRRLEQDQKKFPPGTYVRYLLTNGITGCVKRIIWNDKLHHPDAMMDAYDGDQPIGWVRVPTAFIDERDGVCP